MSCMCEMLVREDDALEESYAGGDSSTDSVPGGRGDIMAAAINTIDEIIESTSTEVVAEDPILAYVGRLSTTKLAHGRLVLEGVCTHCAHCGQGLTDAVSVERGIGPVCSKKGYFEEPKDADEMQAMISLAEFPEVCQFLVDHYRPKGVRGLCNGLVKLASLNRGNHTLHVACCDAVEALGYLRLSNLLRESISIIQLKDSEVHPGCLEVWVKKHAFKWAWITDIRKIPGNFHDRNLNRTIIPIKGADGKHRGGDFEGKRMGNRQMLWELMIRHYAGQCGKIVGKGGFKILPREHPTDTEDTSSGS